MTDRPPISAVIIDDEVNNCEHLQKMLGKYCPKVAVVAKAHDAVSGIRLIEQFQPQLLFLDIKMPGGSGF
ncbi:MAG: response regulator, partial [Marinilabiliaceae bacterium]|nr:response regulator [Marinilabiliaceae bacterium]